MGTSKKILAAADVAIRSDSQNDNELLQDVSAASVLDQRARLRADQVGVIRQKLATSADGHITRAADLLLQAPGGLSGRMSDESYRSFRGAVGAARDAMVLDRQLERLEREYRSRVKVVKERDPYASGSPHSWLSDCLHETDGAQTLTRDDQASDRRDRLQRHAGRVMRAIERDTPYGQMIRKQIEASHRATAHSEVGGIRQRIEAELRALTTDGGITASAPGGAAAFISPPFLLKQFSVYRSPAASFVGALNDTVPLPAFGLQVSVPMFSSSSSVTATSEGNAVADADPTAALNSVNVNSVSGQITLSQAFLDRAGGIGITADVFVMRQLKAQRDANNDTYAITTAISGSQTVAGVSTFTVTTASGVGGFIGDLQKARRLLTNTSGIRIRATHWFANDDLVDFVGAWADAQGRPIALPTVDYAPKKVGGIGYSGLNLAGLRGYGDSNIPAYGTTSQEQVLVLDPSNVLWLASDPIFQLAPSGGIAGSLEAWLSVRNYCACVPLWPQGVATITGAGYDSANFA